MEATGLDSLLNRIGHHEGAIAIGIHEQNGELILGHPGQQVGSPDLRLQGGREAEQGVVMAGGPKITNNRPEGIDIKDQHRKARTVTQCPMKLALTLIEERATI